LAGEADGWFERVPLGGLVSPPFNVAGLVGALELAVVGRRGRGLTPGP